MAIVDKPVNPRCYLPILRGIRRKNFALSLLECAELDSCSVLHKSTQAVPPSRRPTPFSYLSGVGASISTPMGLCCRQLAHLLAVLKALACHFNGFDFNIAEVDAAHEEAVGGFPKEAPLVEPPLTGLVVQLVGVLPEDPRRR